MTENAPVLYGKYQLLELLARGGMAEVFKAKAHGVEGFEKILVIKRILPELSQNPRFVEMFINEAKIAVTLSHANIVHVFDLGRVGESYFIAMEYVAGMDLASVLRTARGRGKRMPPELAVYMLSELAKGLDYAHRRRDAEMRPLNIVHRDVSPQNILLSHEGEVKLTDFGIAKARTMAQQATEFGVIKGKYAYLAPEQLEGGNVDARTDLFAAGTVLYEALSGVNPFRGGSSYDTLQRIRDGQVQPIQSLVPDLPDEVARLVHRAMALAPDDRHAGAGLLYEELLQFLYSSGRRVGARELADYLAELRSSQEEDEGEDQQLRQVFEAESLTAYDISAKDTRVGIRPRPPRSPAHRTPSVTRAKAERRDVTTLALLADPNDPLPPATITRLVRRFGGTWIERPPDSDLPQDLRVSFVMFGDRTPDGRDTETAARFALRVARAASAVAADTGVQSSLRIGMHAGRITVDLAGVLLEDDSYRRILSDAVQLAQQHAMPGHVVANPDAEKALRGRFRLVLVSSQPPRAFVLTSERSLADSHGRFVGRREELRRIGEVLALANRGDLRIVGIHGEAGAGKSRLLLETLRRLRLAGHKVAMYVATCTPQMRDVPFGTLQDLVRVVLGIDELDPEPLMRERTTRLRELGLTPVEQAAVAAMLGIQTSQRERLPVDRPLKAALLRIARRLADDGLTIFAIDGAEHMDDASRELIGSLLRNIRRARIAVVLTHRPGYVDPWQAFAGYSELRVPPLDEEEVARVMASRLAVEEIPLELLREVTTKSGGNPLYVEEYLKALLDSGALAFEQEQLRYRPEVAHVEVPKTLRGIVAARVARLGPVPRYILQVAAIAGVRFDAEVVATAAEEDTAVVGRSLGSRAMEGIVVRQGPAEHAFAHDLVRQVLLESLTLEARKEIHAAVAQALEELYPDQKTELSDRLARHYREAGLHERAVEALRTVADRYESENALQNAIATLVKAIDWLRNVAAPEPKRLLDIYIRIGQLAYRARDLHAGAERMRVALDLAEATGDERYVARCSLLLGRLLVSASQTEEGRRCLDQARHMARRFKDSGLSRDILIATAEAEARSAAYDKAIRCLQEALTLAEQQEDRGAEIQCLMPLSLTYARMGDHTSAMATLDRSRALAGSQADALTRSELCKLESQIHYHARDPQALIRAASKALEIAKEAGLTYESALNAHNLGEAYLRLGDHKRAFGSLRYSYEIAGEHGLTKLQMANMRILGFIDAVRFGSEEGLSRLMHAIEYAESHGYVWDVIQGRYLLALVEQSRGELSKAAESLRAVLKLAAEHGHRKYVEDTETALEQLSAGETITLQH